MYVATMKDEETQQMGVFNSLLGRTRREVEGKEDVLEAKKEMPGSSRR